MLNKKLLRENTSQIKSSLKSRGFSEKKFDLIVEMDKKWKFELQTLEQLRHELKQATPKGSKPSEEALVRLKKLSSKIKELEHSVARLETELNQHLLHVPNIPLACVPIGTVESDNVIMHEEIRNIKSFNFPILAHDELGEKLGLLNFSLASKISSARFVVYHKYGALLERAIAHFMLDVHIFEHGYTEYIPPTLVNEASLTGTGQFPKFYKDCFTMEDSGLALSPTGEVQLTNLFRNTIINESDLPIKMVTLTPCFRKEAGSHGKDTRGIIRQHEFRKVELVIIATAETSMNYLNILLENAASILKRLEIPYRISKLCTGDLGFASAKTLDIEGWFPSQNRYRELSSCSSFTDFQSRRCMMRYRKKDSSIAKLDYPHTINGSGLAVGRTFACILENYQDRHGGLVIPKALQPYMRGIKYISQDGASQC